MQTVKKLTGFGEKDQKATKLVPQYLQLAVCQNCQFGSTSIDVNNQVLSSHSDQNYHGEAHIYQIFLPSYRHGQQQ